MEEKDQFEECPECGHKSDVKSNKNTPKPFFHFYCKSCGYEVSGTASYPPEVLGIEIDDSRSKVVMEWKETYISNKEILALKKLIPKFHNSPSPIIKKEIGHQANWEMGIFYSGEASDIVEKAIKLGLNAKLVKL